MSDFLKPPAKTKNEFYTRTAQSWLNEVFPPAFFDKNPTAAKIVRLLCKSITTYREAAAQKQRFYSRFLPEGKAAFDRGLRQREARQLELCQMLLFMLNRECRNVSRDAFESTQAPAPSPVQKGALTL